MNDRDLVLGNDSFDELYEFKNLGVVKTILAHSPQMWMKISIRLVKKKASYSLRISIAEKLNN